MKIELVPKYQERETPKADGSDLNLTQIAYKLNEIKAIVGTKGYIAYHVDQALQTTQQLIERKKLRNH